ncbi:uncharacterized protein LOC141570204 [Rhinolophus sinicus]|uniref:uncharacterized protein LOC141570204 n=1 Tax=Rhinolophus sinicus TaxID=89399 RepID=UPI003D793606
MKSSSNISVPGKRPARSRWAGLDAETEITTARQPHRGPAQAPPLAPPCLAFPRASEPAAQGSAQAPPSGLYFRIFHRPGSWRRQAEVPPPARGGHAPSPASSASAAPLSSRCRPAAPSPGLPEPVAQRPRPRSRKTPPAPTPSPPRCVRTARRAGLGFRNGTEGRAAWKVKAAERRGGRARLREEVLRALPAVLLIPVLARPQVRWTLRPELGPHSRGPEIKVGRAGRTLPAPPPGRELLAVPASGKAGGSKPAVRGATRPSGSPGRSALGRDARLPLSLAVCCHPLCWEEASPREPGPAQARAPFFCWL